MEVQKYGPDLNTSIVWVPAEIGYASPQFTVLGFMRDKTGSVVGTLTILLDADTIGELLRTLDLRRRSRGFCADVESQMIVGMSWNETLGIPTSLFSNFNIPGWMRLQIKTMTNMSDSLVSEAVRLVGAQSLLLDPTPFYRTIETKQYGNTYVDAVSVTGAGLNIRIILVMPEIDFLEQIQSTQGKTIGGVAGAIVFLIVVAFILGHLVTAPFVRLRDRMYMTATLQDDGTVDPPSLLAEVSEMQESYEAMRGELPAAVCARDLVRER
jgi:gas vesicle protein